MNRQNFALLTLIFVLLSCSSAPRVVKHQALFKNDGVNVIYVVNHGWHTGIVLPIRSVQKGLPGIINRFEGAEYIEFGWGDQGFYQAQKITVGLVVRAIFWPTKSVMHTVAIPAGTEVNAYFSDSEIEELNLNDEQLLSLAHFIANSFYRNEEKAIVSQRKGLYGDSQFYQGAGDYYLMNTCNKWTAKGLKSIGMDLSLTFKLTAGSVMDYLRRNHKQI